MAQCEMFSKTNDRSLEAPTPCPRSAGTVRRVPPENTARIVWPKLLRACQRWARLVKK
jgi:hypothetical protein